MRLKTQSTLQNSPTKSGLSFFNIDISSIFEDIDALSLTYVDNDITKIKDLEPNTTTIISVLSKLKWIYEKPILLCGEKASKSL